MAILKMCRISIYAISAQLKDVLEFLQRQEVVEITESELLRTDTARLTANLGSASKTAQAALDTLAKYAPAKKRLFLQHAVIDSSAYRMEKKSSAEASDAVGKILRYRSQIEKNKDDIAKINIKCELLKPYEGMDVPMKNSSTQLCRTAVGTCAPIGGKELLQKIKEQGIRLYFEMVNRTKQKSFVWFLYLKEDEEKINGFFKDIRFAAPHFSLSHHTPVEKIKILSAAREKLENENRELVERIRRLSAERKNIELYYDHILLKKERYDAVSKVGATESVYVIEGYIPEKYVITLRRKIEKSFCAAVEIEKPAESEVPPVAFSNSAFAAPVEEITESYSMPSKNDIDPNPIMAFFYYWFFGMMFSDAGYGLIMVIVCGVLGFFDILKKDKRQMFKMFFYCGISTTFWGILYGGFFGDLIGTVSKTFGSGKLEFKPVLIDPINQALKLLIISIAFGLIHMLAALCIKFYMRWKSGDKWGAVYDVGFWIRLLCGAAVMAVGIGISARHLRNIGIYMEITATLGLVLTQGRDKKNIFARIFSGILSLYDITGYVGDVLSYSRLMALGLATGVIASVVNILGSLGGNSPLGIFVFVLIALFGHSLNFAINMLGAYVHTNRLQYVEFYQKFYEGGGRKFTPFKMDTKYYEFSKND